MLSTSVGGRKDLILAVQVHGASVQRAWSSHMSMLTLAIDPNTHDAFMILDGEETVSSASVYPGSVEEVQVVVKWANKHLIPIYPISMGRNRTSKFPEDSTTLLIN